MTLEELCVARGLTLPQLVEAAGVPLLTVFEIDAGTRRPPPPPCGASPTCSTWPRAPSWRNSPPLGPPIPSKTVRSWRARPCSPAAAGVVSPV
jgi:hypothetical protein